jgi:hypothetical protein
MSLVISCQAGLEQSRPLRRHVARLRRAREKMYWFLAALPPKTNTFFLFQSEALDFAQALVPQMPSLTRPSSTGIVNGTGWQRHPAFNEIRFRRIAGGIGVG